MEENPRHPRPNKRAHKSQSTSRPVSPPPPLTSSSSSSKDLDRYRRAGEKGECSVDCSGQSCRSCSAALVADCVALCCCPLAVVSLIGLAFIKVPCAVGKRCFGRSKREEKRKLCVGRKQSVGVGRGNEKGCFGKEEEFGVRIVRGRSRETVLEFGEKEGVEAEAVETDNVLLEMYQLGHLGFGRVSYTETQPNGIIDN